MDDESDLSNIVNEHWNVNEKLQGVNCVSARLSHDDSHMNLYIGSNKVEIPNSVAKISDNKYGVNVSLNNKNGRF